MDGAVRARRYATLRATMETSAGVLDVASVVITGVGLCIPCPPLAAAGMGVAILRGLIAFGLYILGHLEARVKTGPAPYDTPVTRLLPLLIQHMQLMVSKAENSSAILNLLEVEHAETRCSSQAAMRYRRCLIIALGHMPGHSKDLRGVLNEWYKWSSRTSFLDARK